MRTLLVAAVTLGACSDPTVPTDDAGTDAPSVDAPVDAVPIDSDPNAPDAVDAPPLACPPADSPATVAGTPPTGAWAGRWSCVAECNRPTADPLFTATSVTAGATITWRTPGGTIQHAATASRGCWVVAATECTSGYALCTTPGVTATQVQFASVFQLDVGRWQVWEWRGHVP